MNEPTTSHRLRAMIFHPLGEMIIDHDTIYQTNKQIISGHHYERTSKHAVIQTQHVTSYLATTIKSTKPTNANEKGFKNNGSQKLAYD
ncbi:hypothetical protein BLOT_010040 [Blomia tropicalis]|nr:hypothetical protein BLOT_010040 [Blomia tropicalis]